MVYRVDAMIPIEFTSTTWRHLNFDNNHNMEGLENSVDFIEEVIRMLM